MKTQTMKTEILNGLKGKWGLADYLYCNEGELVSEIEKIIDKFGLYAIELIGKDEPITELNLFGDRTIVPERVYRNELRAQLREKLRKELFK